MRLHAHDEVVWSSSSARCALSPLVGKRWRGGYSRARVYELTPPPWPSPTRGEGTRKSHHRKLRGRASIHHSVIASQRVRAKRGPMTGSATRSSRTTNRFWIASSLALLAMTMLRAPDAAQRASGALLIRGPLSAIWVPAQRRVIACRAASGTRKRPAIANHLLSRSPPDRFGWMKSNNSHRLLAASFRLRRRANQMH